MPSLVSFLIKKREVSDATYYGWRKKFGGMGPSKFKRMKELEKENQTLLKTVSALTFDSSFSRRVSIV